MVNLKTDGLLPFKIKIQVYNELVLQFLIISVHNVASKYANKIYSEQQFF